jgi:type I restriction enzyme S subunit
MKRKGIFTTENTERTEVDAVASVRSVVNTEDLPDGFQMTELGPLPKEWRVVRLGEVFDILQGKSLSAKQNKGVRPRPFLRTSNVYWGYLDLSKLDVMDFTEEEEQKFALQRGDLLVCEGGDVGRTAMWEGQMQGVYYQNHLHRLRARDNNVNPAFVMYWLQTAFTLLNLYSGSSNKTTIPNLSQGRLAVFPIPLPPLPEQRAIAHVLRTVQRAKDATEGVIAALKELKKSLMQHLFTYGPVPVGAKNFSPQRESEIGPLPAHWRVVRLGEVAAILMGQSPPSESYNSQGIGLPFLQGKAEFGEVYPTSIKWCSRPLRISPPGAILLSVRAPVGDVNLAPFQCCIGRGLAAICANEKVDTAFLFHWLRLAKPKLEEHGTGTTFQSINRNVLENFPIPLPPLDEQREIARMLQAVDAKIAAEQARRAALEEVFKTLLHQLMTGKIRVKGFHLPELERTP